MVRLGARISSARALPEFKVFAMMPSLPKERTRDERAIGVVTAQERFIGVADECEVRARQIFYCLRRARPFRARRSQRSMSLARNSRSPNHPLKVGGGGGTRTRGPLLAKQAKNQSKSLLRLRLSISGCSYVAPKMLQNSWI